MKIVGVHEHGAKLYLWRNYAVSYSNNVSMWPVLIEDGMNYDTRTQFLRTLRFCEKHPELTNQTEIELLGTWVEATVLPAHLTHWLKSYVTMDMESKPVALRPDPFPGDRTTRYACAECGMTATIDPGYIGIPYFGDAIDNPCKGD